MISVGIDISKDKSTVCMLRPYGEVVETPYSIDHTEQALNALIERIKSFDEDVKVVLEAKITREEFLHGLYFFISTLPRHWGYYYCSSKTQRPHLLLKRRCLFDR